MSKRANRKPAPAGRKGRYQVLTESGWMNTTTWPYDRHGNVKPKFRVNW